MNRQTVIGTIGTISVGLAAMSYLFPWFGAMAIMFCGMIVAEEIVKSYPPTT